MEDASYISDARYRAKVNQSSKSSKINWEITMLVLSRKLGEKIIIGDNIVVTVVKIDRNQIRIGIEAPSDIPVYREEIAPQRLTHGRAIRSGRAQPLTRRQAHTVEMTAGLSFAGFLRTAAPNLSQGPA